jgi:hypothetical protein
MSELVTPVTVVLGSEKVWDYMEIDMPSLKKGGGSRRYRVAQVNRDGKLAEFREDMGPARTFKGKRQLHIPSLWEHTYDELRDLGQTLREESPQDEIDALELAGVLRQGNDKVKIA